MTLVTTRQAAALAKVSVGTVDSWRRRGLLKPVRRAINIRGKPWLYRPAEVLIAEREARRRDPTRRRQTQLANDLLRDGGWPQSGNTPPS
jgi:phage terminase Nu1 subunit (DNA packaging protein)